MMKIMIIVAMTMMTSVNTIILTIITSTLEYTRIRTSFADKEMLTLYFSLFLETEIPEYAKNRSTNL